MKRMSHPLHGFHHAYNTHEAEAMRKNGWVDDVDPAKEVSEKSEDDKPAAPVKRPYNRKAT